MREFWENRAKKYGHTGWSDVLIYAYDQQARLLAVEEILKSLTYKNSVALDFGAGVGDFSNILSRYFTKVISFDISNNAVNIAKRKYQLNENIQFVSGSNINGVWIEKGTIDAIFSITVLDHILDDSELIETVRYFSDIITQDGILILLEYSLDFKKGRTSYQSFRTLNEWILILSKCNFCLYEYYNFNHPLDQPCASYEAYRNSIKGYKENTLKILAKLGMYNIVGKYSKKLANKYLEGKNDFFWEEDGKKSPLKIMIFKTED